MHSSHTAISSGHPSLQFGLTMEVSNIHVELMSVVFLLYFMSLEIASSNPGCPETGCVVEGGTELFKITFKSSIYETGDSICGERGQFVGVTSLLLSYGS